MTIRVSPSGTRGARVPNRGPLAKLFKLTGKLQIRNCRRSGGQRLSSRMGSPVVLLTTGGAKPGAPGQQRSGVFRTDRTPGLWSPRWPEPQPPPHRATAPTALRAAGTAPVVGAGFVRAAMAACSLRRPVGRAHHLYATAGSAVGEGRLPMPPNAGIPVLPGGR